MHGRTFGKLRLLVLAVATLVGGCASEDDLRAVIAETEAFCAANPVPEFPPSVKASSIYVGAGALTRSWMYWIPERLLKHGFTEVESAASIAPYIAGSGEYLRFRIADAADPGCAGQQALALHLGAEVWQRISRHWADLGLRPDQCLAIDRTSQRRSAYRIEAWNASDHLSDLHVGLPVERKRIRFVATDAANGRVLHEHFAEYGNMNASFAVPFGCMRRPEWDRFSDELVQGAGNPAAAEATGPIMVEQVPVIDVLTGELQRESSRDLGGVPIDGLELSRRRERSSAGGVEGFEVLEGDGHNPHETHPDAPRYLQMVANGSYRRIRLAWLQGQPHGTHDRPIRMFDLGDRVGLLAITRSVSPESRGAFALSWAELARDSGLPVRRVEGVMPIDPAPDVTSQSLIEDVQPDGDGLRFTLTEIGVREFGVRRTAGADSHFVLLKETKYRWLFR